MFVCVCGYLCVCVYVFIQDPDPDPGSDPKLCEKSDPDPDPKKNHSGSTTLVVTKVRKAFKLYLQVAPLLVFSLMDLLYLTRLDLSVILTPSKKCIVSFCIKFFSVSSIFSA